MKTKLCRPILVEVKEKDNKTYPAKIAMENNILFDCYSCKYSYHTAKFYDLILVSLDDKIEVNETYYSTIHEAIFTSLHKNQYFENEFKVIATQDQLSPDYIKKFIEEYNKGEVKDVEIEMEWILEFDEDESMTHCREISIPVNQPKFTNGFITIVKREDQLMYTEDEVREILEYEIRNFLSEYEKYLMDKWEMPSDFYEKYRTGKY